MVKLSINNLIDRCVDSFSSSNLKNENAFPIHTVPTTLQKIIRGLSDAYGYNIDYIACSILSAISTAIGLTHRIKIKGSWSETALLYMVLVGKPGANKSAPLSLAYLPIYNKDEHDYKIYQRELTEFKNAKNVENAESAHKPKRKQTIINDATLEAVAYVLSFNRRGLSLVSDELAGWIKNFNRYNKGSDQEFWLSNFSGTNLSINRKNDESILISNPFINVIGTIQPTILNKLIKDVQFDNGFWDRILLVYPNISSIPVFKFEEPDESFTNAYSAIIEKLSSLDFNNGEPNYLTLTDDAKDLFALWNGNKKALIENTGSDKLASIYAKLEVYVFRFALLYQLVGWACEENDKKFVGVASMSAAVATVEYFKNTALKLFPVNASTPVVSMTVQQQKIYSELEREFTTGAGVEIASKHEMNERSFKEWIKDESLFTRQKHGLYSKALSALSA